MQRCLHCNYCNTVFVWTIIRGIHCWSYVPVPSLLSTLTLLLVPQTTPKPLQKAVSLSPPPPPHTREVCCTTKGLKRGAISPVTVSPGVGQEACRTMGKTFIRHFNANTGVCCLVPRCLGPGHSHRRPLWPRNKRSFISFIGYPLIGEAQCCHWGNEGEGVTQAGWKKRKSSVGWAFNWIPCQSFRDCSVNDYMGINTVRAIVIWDGVV